MTTTLDTTGTPATQAPDGRPGAPATDRPRFILYLPNQEYAEALNLLAHWVQHLLLPVYGRETTSLTPWCPQWWQHPEAVAQLHGLWLAWHELTGPGSALSGPATWHRDYLHPVMGSLRDPAGPFAGCKPGAHRAKESPRSDQL